MNTPEQPLSNAASAIKLEPDKPTGEQPMELFITDEHTEYYLGLKAGGDSDRGLLTGGLVRFELYCGCRVTTGLLRHIHIQARSMIFTEGSVNPSRGE